jgi:hypothetical protein
MQERYLGRIQPGMDVCDSKGSRFGSVARVYRYDAGEVGATTSAVGAATVATARDEILEVKTGPFGLGKHFFVPLGQIHEVIEDSVILSVAGHEDDLSRFRSKPAYFDQLH